ncbi:N-acetyltransferase DgcN [Paraglaciecola sp. 2405UD69-4]|uniref:N-acetyltransferase DgcN n=1 Tax=Paraglaciecola sp. 2405UD69-4 TaxID=3391836 RepID=UPI0039C90FC2
MNINYPYLLFIGDATDSLSIKMARSAADWSPEKCLAEYRLPGCTVSTGCPEMNIQEAAAAGAKSFVLGFANSGGILDPQWIPTILEALDAGMDIVSGLHDKLTDFPELTERAKALNLQLIDIRHPNTRFKTGTAKKRQGKRLLTVGTDCSVGKMYTSLSLTKEIKSRNLLATFRATGQSGILVSGNGVAIDCVISDFISGAAESISPDNEAEHWDIIEGQGSLSHPAFAGVSLGLLHGSQPDALVVCHALGRTHMRGLPHQGFPTVIETIELNLTHAKLTNPNAKVVGVAVNTSSVDDAAALQACKEISEQTGLPCCDPIRHGVASIIDNLP